MRMSLFCKMTTKADVHDKYHKIPKLFLMTGILIYCGLYRYIRTSDLLAMKYKFAHTVYCLTD